MKHHTSAHHATAAPSAGPDLEYRQAYAVVSRAANRDRAFVAGLLAEGDVFEAAERIIAADTSSRSPAVAARADLERADAIGARLICPLDSEWPHELFADLRAAAGKEEVPVALWARGRARLDDLTRHAIAVTGSRACTQYGAAMATGIATDLARSGWSMVAGLGFGIDAAVHTAALKCPAPTMAVVASGIDRPYPAQHAQLYDDITHAGLVISEQAPGATVSLASSRARNRMLAALTTRTVVVEAGLRSGALDVAAWSYRLKRPVFAVPGPITSAVSVGCHTLIGAETATLATNATTVLTGVTDHPQQGTPKPARVICSVDSG